MPINQISGPFCVHIYDTYIAHETENAPTLLVPIIMEDSGGNVNILPENAVFSAYGVICGDNIPGCCNVPSEFKFISQTRTEIIYGASLRAKHGTYPNVFMYYYQVNEDAEDAEIIVLGTFTRVSFFGNPPTKIVVDHGGPATGIVKLV